jgi:hypothetical protein
MDSKIITVEKTRRRSGKADHFGIVVKNNPGIGFNPGGGFRTHTVMNKNLVAVAF